MHRPVLYDIIRQLFFVTILAAPAGIVFLHIPPNPFLIAVTIAALLLLMAAVLATMSGICNLQNATLLLWILLVAHRAFVPRVEPVDPENLEWSAVVVGEVSITIAIFLSSVSLFIFRLATHRFGRLPTTCKLLLFYAVVAAFSLVYTPSTFYAGFWLLRLMSAVLLFAVYFSSAKSTEIVRFAKVTLLAVMPYIIFPWIVFVQNQFVGDRVGGYWVHPIMASSIGYAVAIAYFLMWVLEPQRKWSLILCLISFTSAYMAAGKASALAMVIVLGIIFTANWRNVLSARGTALIALLCTAVGYLATVNDVGLLAHWRTYGVQNFHTLEARVYVWRTAISMWLDSPMLGQGFASTNVTKIHSLDSGWITADAHNSLMQALLEVGLLGSAPLFLAIAIVLFRTVRIGPYIFRLRSLGPIAAAWYVLLLCGLTAVLFGSGLLQPSSYLFLGLLVTIDALGASAPRVARNT
jgi:O-antigen ligase